MSTRTFVLCKPDAVERGLVGEIIGRFERRGLTISAIELRRIDAHLAGRHYDEHATSRSSASSSRSSPGVHSWR